MTDSFLSGPLEDLSELISSLGSALERLAALGPGVAGLEALAEEVRGAQLEARDRLAEAELFEELQELEESAPAQDEYEGFLSALMALLNPLKADMAGAVEHAQEVVDRLPQLVESTEALLRQRKGALLVVLGRAQAVVEARRREREAPPETFEETMPFEERVEVAETEIPERRRHPREGTSVEVRLEAPNRLLAGSTENVSVGGVFVATSEPFELGTLVHVVCMLPEGGTVHADGVVAWVREGTPENTETAPPGIGVEFLALSDKDRAELETLAQTRSQCEETPR